MKEEKVKEKFLRCWLHSFCIDFINIRFISINWRSQTFIHSSDRAHAAGMSSNLQGDSIYMLVCYILGHDVVVYPYIA